MRVHFGKVDKFFATNILKNWLALLATSKKSARARKKNKILKKRYSFADDATLISTVAESALQASLCVRGCFCAFTGMILNMKKTVALGIPQGTESDKIAAPYSSSLHVNGVTNGVTWPTFLWDS